MALFREAAEYFGTCIRVVSLGRLPEFAREAKAFAGQLRDELKPEWDRIVASSGGEKAEP